MSDLSALVRQLVAIDSVNPTLVPGGAGEAEIGRFAAGWLAERGVDVEVEELEPGRINVVGRVRGTGGGRVLLLNGHLDTVGLGGPDEALSPRVAGSSGACTETKSEMRSSSSRLKSCTAVAEKMPVATCGS